MAVTPDSSSLGRLGGVGPALITRLQHIGVHNVQDLLFHLPYRYIDRTRLTPLGGLVAGQEACIQGRIELVQVQFAKRRSLLCLLDDGTGTVLLRFFHFSRYQQAALTRGSFLSCWGMVRRGNKGLEMVHPEYRRIDEHELGQTETSLTPVYPATEGISQTRLRKLTEQALARMQSDPYLLEDLLPPGLMGDQPSVTLAEAIRYLHRPPPDADIEQLVNGRHPAQLRLAYEELLAHQLSLRELRSRIRHHRAHSFRDHAPEPGKRFLASLPYSLTAAQQRVLDDIRHDLDADIPMLRLIQGDVGSGKTVVAACAAMRALSAGMQVALMAPTELLAEQHYASFVRWFDVTDIDVVLLTGRLRKSERRTVLERLARKQPVMVIGTHALFQEEPGFAHLGLVIIDEQHRFGVDQRLALIEKGSVNGYRPHQLVMTATPIPRTLAMAMFAELDVSVIDELPPGRQPVATAVVSSARRDEIMQRIAGVCDEGHQVYWVCPLIEESDTVDYQAAIKTHANLAAALPQLRVGLIHGRMKAADKESVMTAFKQGEIQLLVATTVIEVGVDVPNASLMIIENAERMGLSQLHQLRGRVGRGHARSHCVLLYRSPLGELARNRLEVMRTTNDGFVVAEKDLELRGPGDMLGTRQTGLPELRIADLGRDGRFLPAIRQLADRMLTENPDQARKLIRRWLSHKVEYGHV